MEYLKLIGVLIIVVGFALKWETTFVVILSAVVTGLVSGIDIVELLKIIGKTFVDQRPVSLFFLTIPMVGLVESHGLKDVALRGIKNLQKMTAGKILNIYLVLRELTVMFGISLQGQVQFVRPMIMPMVQAASEKDLDRELTERELEMVKGRSAAIDNIGNFFAQNLFVASGGVLLISSTMKGLGYSVQPTEIVAQSIPVAVITFVFVFIYNAFFDRKMKKTLKVANVVPAENTKNTTEGGAK